MKNLNLTQVALVGVGVFLTYTLLANKKAKSVVVAVPQPQPITAEQAKSDAIADENIDAALIQQAVAFSGALGTSKVGTVSPWDCVQKGLCYGALDPQHSGCKPCSKKSWSRADGWDSDVISKGL